MTMSFNLALIARMLASQVAVSSALARFPSMVFFENSSATPEGEAKMHGDEVEFASQYALAIAGWGADAASPPASMHEEEKLANISRLIKAASPKTLTVAYAGQFEYVVPMYDLQRKIMEDPAYDGFFMKDDNGKFLKQGSFRIWDFRNASAVAYHTNQVAGYFARETGAGVDGVFFDEGDAFACQYNCKAHNTCKTMPNATQWHEGDIQAWLGAAKVMADVGKRAVLSSQNAFANCSPELWKEEPPKGCPYKEDIVAKKMVEAKIPFVRFYEYWLTPEGFSNPKWLPGGKEKVWKYCRNQIANAVEEGKRDGINFVAAGTSGLPGWGTPDRMKALEFSLAGFLIARSRQVGPAGAIGWEAQSDYFGFDHQEGKNNPENCSHTRWGDCSHNYDEVRDAYARDYGVPLDDAVEVSTGKFIRHYSKVKITLSCGKDSPSGVTWEWESQPKEFRSVYV